MIRNLLATTAIATLVATGAMAQTTAPAPTAPAGQDTMVQPEAPMVVKADGHLASNIIGESVYNGTSDDAENIGEVEDIVIGADGNIQAVVIGVGGFLGIGQKHVAIEYDLVEWVDQENDRWLVVETSREALEAQQEFDAAAYRPMPADAEVGETTPATAEDLANAPVADEAAEDDMAAAPAEDDMAGQDTAEAPADMMDEDMAEAPATDETVEQDTAAAPATDDAAEEDMAEAPAADEATDEDMAAAPADEAATDETQTAAIDRSTLSETALDQIRAEDFVGTTVYGANDENVGEIGDVVLTADGEIDAILIDVGGFLGVGEKEVAVGLDNLAFLSDEDGDMYLYTNLTEEQLEAQPAYDEAGYAESRDEMRMTIE